MIELAFNETRSRNQIKNKFNKEERKNKKMVDDAIKNKDNYSLKDYESSYGKIKFKEYEDIKDESEEEDSESEEISE